MLPFLETMKLLGIATQWNGQNTAVSMSKDGISSTHSVYTNTITVNGTVKLYDTPTALIDGEIFIPSIMVADIIGYDSMWEHSMYSVLMRPRDPYSISPASVSASVSAFISASGPNIISFTANKNTVMVGEELIVNVIANADTSRVRLTDNSGNVVATSDQYTKIGSNNSFNLRYVPSSQTLSFIQYKVEAGNAGGYNSSSAKAISINVNQGLEVISAVTNGSVYENEYASVTITASEGATRVRLTDKDTSSTVEKTAYTTKNGNRVFELEIKASQKGEKSYGIEVGNASGYVRSSRVLSFNVLDARPSGGLSIKETVYSNRTFYRGESVSVTVRTSLSAVGVDVYDNQTRSSSNYTKYTDYSDYRAFTVSISPSQWGSNSFVITAYDKDGRKVDKTIYATAGSSGYYNNYYDNYYNGYYYGDYYYNGYYPYVTDGNGYYDQYGYYHSYGSLDGYYDSNGVWHPYYEDYFNYNGLSIYYNPSYGNYGYYDSYGSWHKVSDNWYAGIWNDNWLYDYGYTGDLISGVNHTSNGSEYTLLVSVPAGYNVSNVYAYDGQSKASYTTATSYTYGNQRIWTITVPLGTPSVRVRVTDFRGYTAEETHFF
jgi:hypothetical protein